MARDMSDAIGLDLLSACLIPSWVGLPARLILMIFGGLVVVHADGRAGRATSRGLNAIT